MTDSDRDHAAESLKRRLDAEMAKRLMAAALMVQAEHKRSLSVANPAPHDSPAPKGSFPAGRTWNLRDSVAVSPDTLAGVASAGSVRVGVLKGAFYGAALTNRGWLGIRDTLSRVRGRVQRMLGEKPGGGSP